MQRTIPQKRGSADDGGRAAKRRRTSTSTKDLPPVFSSGTHSFFVRAAEMAEEYHPHSSMRDKIQKRRDRAMRKMNAIDRQINQRLGCNKTGSHDTKWKNALKGVKKERRLDIEITTFLQQEMRDLAKLLANNDQFLFAYVLCVLSSALLGSQVVMKAKVCDVMANARLKHLSAWNTKTKFLQHVFGDLRDLVGDFIFPMVTEDSSSEQLPALHAHIESERSEYMALVRQLEMRFHHFERQQETNIAPPTTREPTYPNPNPTPPAMYSGFSLAPGVAPPPAPSVEPQVPEVQYEPVGLPPFVPPPRFDHHLNVLPFINGIPMMGDESSVLASPCPPSSPWQAQTFDNFCERPRLRPGRQPLPQFRSEISVVTHESTPIPQGFMNSTMPALRRPPTPIPQQKKDEFPLFDANTGAFSYGTPILSDFQNDAPASIGDISERMSPSAWSAPVNPCFGSDFCRGFP